LGGRAALIFCKVGLPNQLMPQNNVSNGKTLPLLQPDMDIARIGALTIDLILNP
jgi:hypothetical protein